jgi:RNA recognition motif-containing protein
MNIFVGSLPFRIEEDELKEIFEEYGDVSSVRIITDKFSGRSKGFGFIDMPNDEEAKKAIEGLNGATGEGRAIVVNEAEEKKERRPGGFGGGGNFRGGDNRGGYKGGGYNKGGDNRGGGNRRPSY